MGCEGSAARAARDLQNRRHTSKRVWHTDSFDQHRSYALSRPDRSEVAPKATRPSTAAPDEAKEDLGSCVAITGCQGGPGQSSRRASFALCRCGGLQGARRPGVGPEARSQCLDSLARWSKALCETISLCMAKLLSMPRTATIEAAAATCDRDCNSRLQARY